MKILSDNIVKKNAKKKPLDFAKYRVGKEYNLPMDAQEYVRALRDVDDFVERQKSAEEERKEKVKKMRGCLSEYARPDAMDKEKGAWARAVVEKYGNV